jgi:quercetin dioxygenase-like cupin family protein
MTARVVVTGVDPHGVSKVEHDAPVAAAVALSSVGMQLIYPWQVALPPATVGDGEEPIGRIGSFQPPPGSLNFVQFVVPPGAAVERDEAALQAVRAEIGEKLPGLLASLEPAKGVGMHHTPTLDLFTVVSGRPVLRLDDGSETELAPGDCIVQRGATHAWHNRTDQPCVLSGVMIALARS